MIKIQLVSTVSGIWDVDEIPIGWRATHEDYDGAEDALNDCQVFSNSLYELMDEVREWDDEHFIKVET